MARLPADDDAPWLAEGVREQRATLVPRARLVGGGLIAVLLAVLVALGVYFAAGHKSDGSGGYARPEDAPLIAADTGPDKVAPADPGGARITGIDDSIAAAAAGNDQGSAIAPDVSEEPLARPGTPGSVPPPTDLLPATIAPPVRTIAPVPVAPTAAVPAAGPAPAKSPPAGKSAPLPVPKPPAADPAKVKSSKPTKPDATDPLAAPLAAKPTQKSGTPKAGAPEPDAPAGSKSGDIAAKRGAALQLGAFSTRDKAEAAWAKAGGDGALGGLAQRIEPVERDGTTLYRLRAAGVPSKDAAKALCARVHAAGNACIVAE